MSRWCEKCLQICIEQYRLVVLIDDIEEEGVGLGQRVGAGEDHVSDQSAVPLGFDELVEDGGGLVLVARRVPESRQVASVRVLNGRRACDVERRRRPDQLVQRGQFQHRVNRHYLIVDSRDPTIFWKKSKLFYI